MCLRESKLLPESTATLNHQPSSDLIRGRQQNTGVILTMEGQVLPSVAARSLRQVWAESAGLYLNSPWGEGKTGKLSENDLQVAGWDFPVGHGEKSEVIAPRVLTEELLQARPVCSTWQALARSLSSHGAGPAPVNVPISQRLS